MNCAIHTDVPAVAYCRTCGKPLCGTCKRDVRGVIYCEECIASRLGNAMPAASAVPAGSTVVPGTGPAVVVAPAHDSGSPALAAMLGFIPGVGAMYNGQFVKGLIHVGIFATLVYGADHVPNGADVFFGFGIAFWIFYMVFDAYKTALAKNLGLPLPDPFGFERLWGGSVTGSTGMPVAAPERPVGGGAATVVPGVPLAEGELPPQQPPVGAFIMIGLGVLFLLNTLEVFHWHWIGRFWPVFLIVIGVWTWIRRTSVRE